MILIKAETVSWVVFLAVSVIAGGVFLRAQSSQISPEEAQAYLNKGARVIDVRTPGEFSAGHLPNAINIPLAQIQSGVPLPLKDKNQVLLLHCQSGIRSAMAKKLLDSRGYTNVFNLGSYSRAAQIVAGK
jgi:rhodanese-related sulfurtransferase